MFRPVVRPTVVLERVAVYAGIDLGQRRIHGVMLDAEFRLVEALVIDVADMGDVERILRGCDVTAVDAPERLSSQPHAGDVGLASKFRVARCAEITLGVRRGIWVPWVTPAVEEAAPEWMRVGFRVFERARDACPRVLEVFPYAGFRVLAGTSIAPKSTPQGLAARARLLEGAGVRIEGLQAWAHDSLDACLAALVARQVAEGVAEVVTCGHDGSAIWLPQPRAVSS